MAGGLYGVDLNWRFGCKKGIRRLADPNFVSRVKHLFRDELMFRLEIYLGFVPAKPVTDVGKVKTSLF